MNSTFSGHFGYRRLLRVTLPSIVMMIFTSIYCVTDGFFVSNFAGKAAFTAVNFIMPYLMILGCVGFLFNRKGVIAIEAAFAFRQSHMRRLPSGVSM